MFKMTAPLKKITLVTLVLAIGLAMLPLSSASAATLNSQTNSQPRNSSLEKVWAREQKIYQRQSNRLAKASAFITKVQGLIDKANAKGWDTSSLQTALNNFSAAIPAAQAAHDPGAAIIASHAGFDANGAVTDRATAITTVKSLFLVLKGTHTAMNGTGTALCEAIKAFRDTHPGTTTPTP